MGSTDATASYIQQLRNAMLVRYSTGQQLDALGNNFGVPRPPLTSDDEIYRRIIETLAWLPKAALSSYYWLLNAVFGTQESIRAGGGQPWRVFEVKPNEVVIELPSALVAGTNEIASYLHGATGYAQVVTGPTNQFTTTFDLAASSATSLVGLQVNVNTSGDTWTAYTINAYSFAGGVGTVTVNASTLPTGGGRFYLVVPGDLVASYRGHYLATGGFLSSYSTAAGPSTNTLSVVGDATQDVSPGHTVLISINGAFQTRVVSTLSYSTATNVTTVTISTTDVPGGQTNQSILLAQELADLTTTPPHNDRIYLTGTGMYQIVQFYLDLLVRAAGISVRLEVV